MIFLTHFLKLIDYADLFFIKNKLDWDALKRGEYREADFSI